MLLIQLRIRYQSLQLSGLLAPRNCANKATLSGCSLDLLRFDKLRLNQVNLYHMPLIAQTCIYYGLGLFISEGLKENSFGRVLLWGVVIAIVGMDIDVMFQIVSSG